MNWTEEFDEHGKRRDLVARVNALFKLYQSPEGNGAGYSWRIMSETSERAMMQLVADLAALCEALTAELDSQGTDWERIRQEVMRHATNPDGTPRWPEMKG